MTVYEYCRALGPDVLADMEAAGLVRPEVRRYVRLYEQVRARLAEGYGRVEAMEITGDRCSTSYSNIRRVCRFMEGVFTSCRDVKQV